MRVQNVVLLLLIGWVGAGCGFSTPSSSPLRVQLVNEPVSLDPVLAQDGVSFQILDNMMVGLVGYDGESKLQNRIAKNYTVSRDGKRYEFTLRKDAVWSDGRPVKVGDFVAAFQRMLGPHTVSRLAPLFFPIHNAKLFHEGRVLARELGVKEGKDKLVIELDQPAPYLIQALALPCAFPIRQDVLDSHGGRWPEEGPVTGPYRLISHEVEKKVVLERNSRFWGEKPQIDRIEFWVVTDESTGLHLFEQGRLDLLTRIPALDYMRLKRTGKVHSDPFVATYYLSFNCRKFPFQDKTWRRAIAGAIRRDEIAENLGSGELPAWSWIPKGVEGFQPFRDPRPVFADSMAAVGKKTVDRGSILLEFDSGSRNSQIMEKIQHDILQNLGLKISLRQMDWRGYIKSIQTDPSPMFRLGWMAPFLDPIVHLKVFTTPDVNNYSGFSNKRYDELVELISKMSPGDEREKKIQSAQKILLEDEAAVVPLYHYVQNTAVSSRVHGFKINVFGVVPIQELSIK